MMLETVFHDASGAIFRQRGKQAMMNSGLPKRTRLCIYVDHWTNGGEESYVMSLLRRWDLTRVSCEILTAQIETDRYGSELEALGVPIYTILKERVANPVARVWKTCRAIRRFFVARAYDAVYFQLANAVTLYYCHVAKIAGIPVRVTHSHCAGIKKTRGYLLKRLAHEAGKRLYDGAPTRRLACSGAAAAWLYPKRRLAACEMIPSGIDVARFRFDAGKREEVRASLGLAGRVVLGTVGRCEEEKNQRFLLSLMVALKDRLPEATLLVVGEGSLSERLKREAAAKGVDGRTVFYGASTDVPALLCAMDVFLLPSLMEGNPLSSVEAQANGLPCLLSDAIPREAKWTEALRFLPITAGAEPWADAVLEIRNGGEPGNRAAEAQGKNADIRVIAARVYRLLFGNDAPTEEKP
jgi:glycosyltransferase involved in cell wall biosynthesis